MSHHLDCDGWRTIHRQSEERERLPGGGGYLRRLVCECGQQSPWVGPGVLEAGLRTLIVCAPQEVHCTGQCAA